MPPPPRSCDCFVIVGQDGTTIFSKNSDRPCKEVHEVVRFNSEEHTDNSKVRCQYIEIPQVRKTFAVVLSRPAWLWGAEMGANEMGLCAGNEAVTTREASSCDDGGKRLLGMDIVRLVLERARGAREAVEVAAGLLEAYGQGGPCEEDGDWCYENSFLFADAEEAWVMETGGRSWWVAERVSKGRRRNISNGISIHRPDLLHSKLLETAKAEGWWDGAGDFDWKLVMLGGGRGGLVADDLEPDGREAAGKAWLEKMCKEEEGLRVDVPSTAKMLRDVKSGICMQGGFESVGSQISVLRAGGGRDVHWFTASPDPTTSGYKPFSFKGVREEEVDNDAARRLWLLHKELTSSGKKKVAKVLREKEETLLLSMGEGGASPELFDRCMQEEVEIVKEFTR
eukprot:764454-Hanusia_phi.AAC.1